MIDKFSTLVAIRVPGYKSFSLLVKSVGLEKSPQVCLAVIGDTFP